MTDSRTAAGLQRAFGRSARSRQGRYVGVAVASALSLLMGVVALSPVRSAEAAPNWFLVNEQGTFADRFGTSEAVLISGSAVGGVGLIPAVDIYVTENFDWSGRDGLPLHDISNPTATPNTAVGFAVIDLPIWIPYLKVGGWDVVIDTNMDGVFQSADQVIGEGSEPGFTVRFDGNRRVIDKDQLKNDYAAPWARAAGQARVLSSMVKAFQIANAATSAASWVEGALTLYSPPPSLASLPCVSEACSGVAGVVTAGASQLKPISKVWNSSPDPTGNVPSGASLCARILGINDPNGVFRCKIPTDPTAAFSIFTDYGAEQVRNAAANLEKVAQGIYADPPDPNYSSVFPYQSPVQVFQPVSSIEPAAAQAQLANLLNDMAARSSALLHAIERFDGAVIGLDEAAAAMQAGSIRAQSLALIESLLAIDTTATDTSTQMRAAGTPGSIAARRAELVQLQSRLAATGLTAEEIAEFAIAGWSAADRDAYVASFLEIPFATIPDDLATVLESMPALTGPAIDALWNLATVAGNIADAAPNQVPAASFSATPTSGKSPLTVSFDASASTDADGSIVSYAWDFGDGAKTTGVTSSHQFTAAGGASFEVRLTVTDDQGGSSTTSTTITVQPQNALPVASFVPNPIGGHPPVEITFDAQGSSDTDGSIAAFSWDFGDGTTAEGSVVRHTFSTVGEFTVRLKVTDTDGGTALMSRVIRVSDANFPPVVDAGPDLAIQEGQLFCVGSAFDLDGSIASGVLDWGNGSTSASVSDCTTYADEGTYLVTVRATDDLGASASDSAVITVSNVPPALVFDAPLRVSPGIARVYSASAADSGVNDTLTFSWDFGDGSTGSGSSPSHAFATGGDFTITVKVSDGDGGTDSISRPVTVAPLIADAGPDLIVEEGAAADFVGSERTTVPDANTTVMWNFGDNTVGFGQIFDHVYRDEGTYLATVTVTDDGGSISDTANVSVANVPPRITSMIRSIWAEPNEAVSFRASAADPGLDDTLSYTWDFGDGTTGTGKTPVHAYRVAGTYNASVLVSDGDGGLVSAAAKVEVSSTRRGDGRLDSRGTDFWLAFNANEGPPELTLFITAAQATTGAIDIPGLTFASEFDVVAGGLTSVSIPASAVMSASSEVVEPKGIHVVASDDVTVYGLNRRQFTTDAFLGLPTDALGTDYFVLGWGSSALGHASEVSVVASENGTVVTFVPFLTIGSHAEGQPFDVVLDAGDVYQLMSADVTGTSIQSTKPVAVFAGNQCANIPDASTFACDHVVEQIPPTSEWGRSFVTAPLGHQDWRGYVSYAGFVRQHDCRGQWRGRRDAVRRPVPSADHRWCFDRRVEPTHPAVAVLERFDVRQRDV